MRTLLKCLKPAKPFASSILPIFTPRTIRHYKPRYATVMSASLSTNAALKSSTPAAVGIRQYDSEISGMASYVHNFKIDSDLAVSFAALIAKSRKC